MHVQKLLNYNLLHELGRGGMASVWYAENSVGRPFAIKLLKPELIAYEPSVSDRFRNEAQIMVKLDHPSIRRVEDYYEEGNTLAIIMEYLDGQDMHHHLRQQGRISETQAVNWFLKILNAFDYVHQKGYFHRDVKPANLFLTTNEQIKVMDFGIAKIVGNDLGLTQTSSVMGSPLYMSPEQILSPKDVDYRTDIYSLGVTLYTLLAGAKPYDDQQQSSFSIQTAIVQQPLPNLPHVSTIVNEAIQKATQKRPSDRFASCNAFAQALVAPLPDLEDQTEISQTSSYTERPSPTPVKPSDSASPSPPSTAANPPIPVIPPSTSVPTPSRFRPVWLIGVVLGLLVLGGGVNSVLFRPMKGSVPVKLAFEQQNPVKPDQSKADEEGIRQGVADYKEHKDKSAFALLTRYQETPSFLNNSEAMTDLGIMYYFGLGTASDLTKSKKWIQKGVDKQNAKAHYFLGLLIDDIAPGESAVGRTEEAVDHYRKGAQGKDLEAQVTLGQLYISDNPFATQDNPCTLIAYLKRATDNNANKKINNNANKNVNQKANEILRELQKEFICKE